MGDYASDVGMDNIVTHLLNHFEQNNQMESISEEDIKNLPITKVTDKQIENGTQCATCMEVLF